MRNLLNFASLFFISLFIISYQNPYVKLSGKPISSDSAKESPLNNAFDGDMSTVFKSQKASEGWIGLKLDSKYKLTKIGVAFPENVSKGDYLLAIIEGSTDPTFLDSETLYMITSEIKPGEMFYLPINSNHRFKYIRYVGPTNSYCIMSELEIYGDDELDDVQKSFDINDEIVNKEVEKRKHHYHKDYIDKKQKINDYLLNQEA